MEIESLNNISLDLNENSVDHHTIQFKEVTSLFYLLNCYGKLYKLYFI